MLVVLDELRKSNYQFALISETARMRLKESKEVRIDEYYYKHCLTKRGDNFPNAG
jgi:hypothetical protein